MSTGQRRLYFALLPHHCAEMVRTILCLAALFFIPNIASAQDVADPERYERWLAAVERQRAFEHSQFAERGYRSIAEAQVEGREVRRAIISDGYRIRHLPGIEIERHSDGEVTLQLQYVGWTSERVVIDPATWTRLAALEDEVFAPSIYNPMPPRSGPPPPRGPVRHCWNARLAAGWTRTESWTACGGLDGTEFEYVLAFIHAAFETRPHCEYGNDRIFRDFQRCFVASRHLDDPELDVDFQRLRAAYSGANTSKELSEVRRMIRDVELELGSSQWLEVRAALERKFVKDRIRARQLDGLRGLLRGRSDVSDADRAKVRQLIRHWSRQEEAWARNNRALFDALVFSDTPQER